MIASGLPVISGRGVCLQQGREFLALAPMHCRTSQTTSACELPLYRNLCDSPAFRQSSNQRHAEGGGEPKGVCWPFPDTQWAVIFYHALLAVSQTFLDFHKFAPCVGLAIYAYALSSIMHSIAKSRKQIRRLFWDHAATMFECAWRHNICAVAQLIKECIDAQGIPGPHRQASYQP